MQPNKIKYEERLKLLNLYSVQRRQDTHFINVPIVCKYSEHRGQSCVVSPVNIG